MSCCNGRRLCRERQRLRILGAGDEWVSDWPQRSENGVQFFSTERQSEGGLFSRSTGCISWGSATCVSAFPWVNQKNANISLPQLVTPAWGVYTGLNMGYKTWTMENFDESNGLELVSTHTLPPSSWGHRVSRWWTHRNEIHVCVTIRYCNCYTLQFALVL